MKKYDYLGKLNLSNSAKTVKTQDVLVQSIVYRCAANFGTFITGGGMSTAQFWRHDLSRWFYARPWVVIDELMSHLSNLGAPSADTQGACRNLRTEPWSIRGHKRPARENET